MSIRLQDYTISLSEVSAHGKSELFGVSLLDFATGETSYLLGKNGSGKSSLLLSIAGAPYYTHTGEITLDGSSIRDLDAGKRANLGIFIALQSIPSIPGVTYAEFLRTIYTHKIKLSNPEFKITPFLFGRILDKHLKDLHLSKEILKREVNVGFSGGEKRRLELLQMRLLDPSVILFDEIESGLDIGAMEILISEMKRLRSEGKTLIITTHNFDLMQKVGGEKVIILEDGHLSKEARFDEISKEDIEQYFDYSTPVYA